ncbi:MAG: serine/threonine protein kinase [Bacteroidales bacterium]|nr:serine/threonine protein kinase [Bacteroidales bacterium]
MKESAPLKRPIKTFPDSGMTDIVPIGKNVYRVTVDGKYWLLKTAGPGSSALIRREYELMCNLSHPCIASVAAFVEDSPVGAAILMEYVQGRNLEEYLAGRTPFSTRWKLLMQILRAVEYIHRKGLLHNDLKSSNIMVADVGEDIKIVDFGFAETEADYMNKKLGGTEGTSAPEVMAGEASLPSLASSDIYSLGGIIRLLFPGRFRAVASKCLRQDPSRRYRSVDALRRAILRARFMPLALAGVLAVLALIAVAIGPDIKREVQEEEAQNTLEASIGRIQSDMQVFYEAVADSIGNRNIVRYRDDAFAIRNTFVEKTYQYRQTIDDTDMQFVCDTVYARLLGRLNDMMIQLPWK